MSAQLCFWMSGENPTINQSIRRSFPRDAWKKHNADYYSSPCVFMFGRIFQIDITRCIGFWEFLWRFCVGSAPVASQRGNDFQPNVFIFPPHQTRNCGSRRYFKVWQQNHWQVANIETKIGFHWRPGSIHDLFSFDLTFTEGNYWMNFWF